MRPSSIVFVQRVVILSLLCTIPLAMILLYLCLSAPLSMVDLFFTATSLCTISGLMVIPLSAFNTIGHCILLCFMQVGGIGLITLSIYFMSFFVNLSIGTQVFSAKLLNTNYWADIKNFLFFIIKITCIIQLLGTLGLLIFCAKHFSGAYCLFIAYFHAVSAFTSAGLVIFPSIFSQSGCLIVLIALMISGEIGFIVWYEIVEYIQSWQAKKRTHFSLHTKIVIHSTLIITLSSFILYCLLEHCSSLVDYNLSQSMLIALFNSVAARGTGFFVGTMTMLSAPTLLIIMLLSFIGASPGSTGSGIKTTSVTLLFAFIRSTLQARSDTTLRGRTIQILQINQVLSLVIVSILWILLAVFALLISESAGSMSIIFEVVSAFGNCGLSLGVTPHLSTFGKIIIACTMIIGRLGCLTIMLAFVASKKSFEYSYPTEKIMIN